MKKLIIPALLGLITFASCNSGNNAAQYTGTWQAKTFETPTEDSLAKVQSQMQIQEVESWTEVPQEFTAQFKISNLDSAKAMAKNLINEQIANREPEREKLISSFQMILTPEGNAYRTTDNVKDTAVWYTAKDNNGKNLIIIDPFVPGMEDIDPRATFTIFEVVHSSGDSMRIQIRQPEECKTYISFKKNK